MASEVEICNLALSNIRAGSINSLDESSLQAQQCKLKYPTLRDMLLREYPWDFASMIKALVPRFDVSVFNWVYVYQYPSDCLYINKLILDMESVSADAYISSSQDLTNVDLGAQVIFNVMNVNGQRVIVSNEPNLRADYRGKVTDTLLFNPTFIQALSWLLASELSVPIVGGEAGRQLRSDAYQVYQNYLATATASHMNEQYNGTIESEFITVRS